MKHWIAIETPEKHFRDIEHFIKGLRGAKIKGRMIGSKIVIKPLNDNCTRTGKTSGSVR